MLTDPEKAAIEMLSHFWRQFDALPGLTQDEAGEGAYHIRAVQNIVTDRSAHREHPDLFGVR